MKGWLWDSCGTLTPMAGVFACLLGADALQGQGTGTLSGRVTDRSTGKGLPGAEIILLANSRSVRTDSSGRYVFGGIPAGESRLIVRAIGFPALHVIALLADGDRRERPIVLDSTPVGRRAAAQSLPPVGVTAAATHYRLLDFERRRQTGRGQYLNEDEIVRLNPYNVADAVKGMRGVTYECGGGGGCFIRMTRAPMRCLPEYIVDDHVQNDFGPTTPIRDVVALEVYTGPSEVPGEYAGRNSGCGVVVIWTRSGPTRKP